MDQLAKVYNDNVFPFEQEFKGKKVRIDSKKYIEMDWEDAIQFKSMFYPPKYDGSGIQKPESYKMIRLEGVQPHVGEQMNVCSCCGDKFATATELESHIAKNHIDQMEDTKAAEKLRKKSA